MFVPIQQVSARTYSPIETQSRDLQQQSQLFMALAGSATPGSPTAIALMKQYEKLSNQSKVLEWSNIVGERFSSNKGMMPIFKQLLIALPFYDPNSLEAQFSKMMIKMAGLFEGMSSKEIDKLLVTADRMALANVTSALYTISANLEPESKEALAIQDKIAKIQVMDQQLAEQMA